MNTLYDEYERMESGLPVLMPIQKDLLANGRDAYRDGIRRVLFQAPCGSGKTWCASAQTQQALDKGKTVMHVAPRRRLVDQMLWTLKKFGVKAAPIMEGRQTWESRVYCASRDTLLAILKAGGSLFIPDLLIVDEAHVAAEMVQQWYLKHAPHIYWCGYTATPVQPDGSSLSPPWQALVSMAPTSKMIELGRLAPVKVYNPDAVGRRRRKGDKVKPVGDPVDHWRKYADGLPTVAYAATVADSRKLVEKFLAAGITAEHIDANTPEDEREAVFERSRLGQTKVISNCGVLIMGVDLPWLECCLILRGCNSLVLYFQAAGRVMRAHEGKTHGILLDHAGAAHEYGLPHADFHWTLEDGATNARKNKPPKERRAVTCMKCGLVFQGGPACPECGAVLPVKKRKSLMDGIRPGDGVLTRFTEDQKQSIQQDVLERLFKKCYYIARAKGQTMATANAMFSREAGMPAWEADMGLNIPHGREWQTPARDWKLHERAEA